MKSMRKWLGLFRDPLLLVKTNLRSIIRFEIFFRLLAMLVFFPVLTWMQRLFLLFNGTSAIVAYNVRRVAVNPLTWIVLLAMGALITLFTVYERFVLVDTMHASRCGKKRTMHQMIRTGFTLTAQRMRPKNWEMVFYILFVLHFGMITDVSSVTSFIHIPGYILERFEKYPSERYVYYLAIILLFYLFLRWAYAFPVMMESDDLDFRKARKKSWEMTRGFYILRVLAGYVFWTVLLNLLVVIAAGTAVIIWFLLSLWLIPGETAPFLTFFQLRYTPAWIVLYIAFSWVQGPVVLSSFQHAYYLRKEELGEPLMAYTEEQDLLEDSRLLRAVILILLAVCVFFSGPRRFAQIRWMMNTQYGVPLIMAHRGYSAAAPENTIPAFEKAIEEGFTAAELDVQMTKDGVIVVLHDSNLKRVTGINKNIWDVTYDEIKDLDAGSHFSKAYAGTPIPTLDEVMKLCRDKLFLNIEIKRNGHDDGIVERTIDVIVENGGFDNCDITSQDYKTIEEVDAINPSILTAYTSIIGLGHIQDLEAADIISIQETFANYDNVQRLHNAGKRVFVWTVNEKSTMERLITLNVDAILTNNPGLCKKVTDEYSSDIMNILRRISHIFAYL